MENSEPDELIEARVAPHIRRLRLRAFRERVRESLLFLPLVMVACAVVIAFLLADLDARHDIAVNGVFSFSPDVAITLLGTIAGAVITTAGVVFSLLVVSLQLASGQFSPRVLRGFWRDRGGQVLVGLLMSTFVFCVLTLARIDSDQPSAPTLTINFALILALLSVLAIVVYLDRISRQQYVGRIMQRVSGETRKLITQLPYGKNLGMKVGETCPRPDLSSLGSPLVVLSPADGWVQQLSRRAIVNAAPPDSVIRLETRVGAWVTAGTPIIRIWPAPANATAVSRVVDDALIVGPARTMQQDIDFGLRQLNDIGLRALSPAVNDPTTAVEVILNLGSVMRPLLVAHQTPQCVRDSSGRVLLTPNDLDKGEFVKHAFEQLRHYAVGHPAVLTAISRTLRMLREACVTPSGRPIVDDDAGAVTEIDRLLVSVDAELLQLATHP
ncbi:DUF2254 domain-containing protein [Hamadaea sp. NPDC050747]|uniref:DUF2254 domain-containing protein n=1 Tax=Hamadaea sp. NPDC050747 TaxID=3155789 RepID=UPI0033DAF1AF